MKKFIILGMMTGTSADGIDAKFCISDGIILEENLLIYHQNFLQN